LYFRCTNKFLYIDTKNLSLDLLVYNLLYFFKISQYNILNDSNKVNNFRKSNVLLQATEFETHFLHFLFTHGTHKLIFRLKVYLSMHSQKIPYIKFCYLHDSKIKILFGLLLLKLAS